MSTIPADALHLEPSDAADTSGEHVDHKPGFFVRWFMSTNHKDIGTLYLIFAICAGIIGGSISGIMRWELMEPGIQVLNRAWPLGSGTANFDEWTHHWNVLVTISVLQPSPAQQNPLLRDPFFRRYMGVPDTALEPTVAAGSGVIVDGRRGLVITNFHVVQEAQAVAVGLKDGRKVAAQPVALAPQLDLAVLRIDAKNLPQLPLGDSDKLNVGDFVVAIGNPFGLGQTVTSGIVSATSRPLVAGDSRRFIQTDAPINPGNSGGPLIDLHGDVVGINSALFSPNGGQGNIGIGFAIPSNVVKTLLSSIKT
jgi:S1-C subfamily serine protease